MPNGHQKKSEGLVEPPEGIFPNHLMLSLPSYGVTMGSFDLSMEQLATIALTVLAEMKRLNQEGGVDVR